VVIDAQTGQPLSQLRPALRRQPASLAKMMTLYLTFEAVRDRRLRLDQKLRTSRHAAGMPASKLGLKPGERITVADAVRAAAVRSSNDAAVVLAEAIGGSETAFAVKMTKKARALGMRHTRFKNASGLTQSGQYSTARDMAILTQRLRADFPRRSRIFDMRSTKVKGRTLRTTNRLLGRVKGVDGMKTGYTRRAGFNLAATAERGGRRVIAVYLGGRSRVRRDDRVTALIADGFKKIERLEKRRRSEDRIALRRAPAPKPRPQRLARQGAARPASRSVLRGWSVQVGAYLDPRDAKAQMGRVLSLRAPGLAEGYSQVKTVGVARPGARARTVYRVRFAGLREADARSACAYLESRAQDCALVPPSGWR
ncbi:MAG: D-alanyl-D-alanine carboxypeptidase family protein, partial [Pseudomonadota bacterium]